MINQLRNSGVALALGGAVASAANAYDKPLLQGWHAGVQFNSTSVTVENSGAGEEDLAGLAGTALFIGYDYNIGQSIVVGGEGGFSFHNSSTDDARSGGDRDTFGLSNELYVRARGGYDFLRPYLNLVGDAYPHDTTYPHYWLTAYGTIGFTNIGTNVTNRNHSGNTGEDLDDAGISGITYGIGVEVGFSWNQTIRVEYTAGVIRRLSLGLSYHY